MGGEEHLKKVAHDVLILILPPVIIGLSLINNGTEIDTFGKLPSWDFAPVTLLIGIVWSYLLGLNFSYKSGSRFLKLFFDIGMLIGAFSYLIWNDSVYFSKTSTFINYTLLMLMPYYVVRIATEKDKLNKIINILLLFVGFATLMSAIDLMYELIASNSFYRRLFKPQVILAMIWYQVVLLGFFIGFLIKTRLKVINYLKEVNNEINETIKGNIKSDLKKLLGKNLKMIYVVGFGVFGFVTFIWLIVSGFLRAFFRNWFNELEYVTKYSSIKSFLIGDELTQSYNHVMSMISSYGIVTVIIFAVVLCWILVSHIHRMRAQGTSIVEQSRFHNILGALSMIVFSFFFNITTLMFFVLWYFIGLAIIEDRESEQKVENYKINELDFLKDSQLKVFANYLRYLLVVIIFVGMFLVIRAILDGVDRGIFTTA